MDMMSNSSIVWHQESINELQIFCLVTFSFFFESLDYGNFEKDGGYFTSEKPIGLVYCLLIHHIIQWIFSVYRKKEIDKRGKPDINGVLRGSCESILATLELLMSSIMFGYMLNYFLSFKTWDKFHDQSLFNYWLVIDLVVMLLSTAYVYIIKWYFIESNLIKNFYSLIFI